MGVIRRMWNLIQGRRAARRAEQADVDRALALQREELRQQQAAFMAETRDLRSAEARMMEALAGMSAEVGRGRRGMPQ